MPKYGESQKILFFKMQRPLDITEAQRRSGFPVGCILSDVYSIDTYSDFHYELNHSSINFFWMSNDYVRKIVPEYYSSKDYGLGTTERAIALDYGGRSELYRKLDEQLFEDRREKYSAEIKRIKELISKSDYIIM